MERLQAARWRSASAIALLGLGALLATRPALPAAPAENETPSAPPIPEPALIEAEGIPVGDLLAELSRKTGVALAADRVTADEKVILFGPARPVREILADLAVLLNNHWERTQQPDGKPRYTLRRSLKAARYEEQLLDWEPQQLLGQADARSGALLEGPERLARRPADDPVRMVLESAEAEKFRTAARLYRRLTPEQKLLLARGKFFRVPFAALDQPEQARVRSHFAELARQLEANYAAANHEVDDDVRQRFEAADLEARGAEFRVVRALGVGLVPKLTIEVRLGRLYSGFLGGFDARSMELPRHGNPYTGEKVPADAPLPEPKQVDTAALERDWPTALRRLAEASGQPVVADYYRTQAREASSYVTHPDAARPDPAALPLDRLCFAKDYLWWTRGKTLLARKRDWYRQRQLEIPNRWLLEVAQSVKARNRQPTYGDVARLAELSRLQIGALQGFVSGRRDFDDIELAGAREAAAIVAAGDRDRPLPLSASEFGPPEWAFYPTLKPAQRALVPALAVGQPQPVRPDQLSWFGLHVARPAEQPAPEAPGYQYVNVRLGWAFLRLAAPPTKAEVEELKKQGKPIILRPEGWSTACEIPLPVTLPDDRRERTKIEIQR